MSSTMSWSGVGLSPPGASSPTDSADSQSASISPPVSAGPPPVFLDSRSFMSARPDFAAEGPRFASRLDGMPWMSATVLRGRSRFGLLADGAAFAGEAFIFGAAFLADEVRRAEALAEADARFLAAFLATFRAAFFF